MKHLCAELPPQSQHSAKFNDHKFYESGEKYLKIGMWF